MNIFPGNGDFEKIYMHFCLIIKKKDQQEMNSRI